MDNVKIGDTIKVIKMEGEPQYTDREGVVTRIDDAGQTHVTWGGCAIIPKIDKIVLISNSQQTQKVSTKNTHLFYYINATRSFPQH